MMWRKAWWECRFRVFLCSVISFFLVLNGLLLLADAVKVPQVWPLYCRLLMSTLVAVTVTNLAGSGVNSQSTWGMFHGFHPSMFFLLSLPVSRRRALLVRAAVGAFFTFLIVAFGVVGFGLTAPLRGVPVGAESIISAIVFLSLFAWALFGFTTFLTTLFDEIISGVLGLGIAGALVGAFYAMSQGRRHIDPLAYIDGELFVRTGIVVWPAVIGLVLTGAAFLLASIYVVERKEY